MARVASAATAKKTASEAKKTKGRKKTATAQFDALQSQKVAVHSEYSKAKKTKSTYHGYLVRSREIIADIVKERKAKEKANPGYIWPDGIDTKLLAKALEGTPNKYSATAVELCLTQKCIVEGLGKSTADGLHGAWANYWDTLYVVFSLRFCMKY